MRYRAYLSYSHLDRKWAGWLHRKLEGYRPPGNVQLRNGDPSRSADAQRLSPIFRDRDELSSATNLSVAINDALLESEWLIVLCSPNAAASRWVNEEIRVFRSLGRADRILCLIIAGEPLSGGATECYPAALTDSGPGGERIEPVAADARPHGDGRSDAALKVIAGMLGVGFDALKHREQRRHNRRLAAITGVSLLVTGLTIALAVTATIARNEANARREQAEDLIDFMLGDLQDQLREIGRLDLYQSIGDKALAYFAALRDDDKNNHSLAQRAKNLRQIGEVRLEQGKSPAALVAFQESLLIMSRLAERDPGNAENQIGLANSHFYVGSVHWQRGDLGAALLEFEQVLPIVDAVVAGDPANPHWLLERGYAYTNLGRILELEGKLDEALDAYEEVLETTRRLIELEPDNASWQLEVGFAHNNIGKLVTALGRLGDAEQSFRYDLDIKRRVYESNPQHNIRRSFLAVSQLFLGQLLASKGSYDEAHALLSEALGHFEELSRIDPAQVQWQKRLANTRRELGKVLVDLGRSDEAIEYIRSSLDQLTRLSVADADDVITRRDLTRTLIALAGVEIQRRNIAAASEHSQSANRQVELLLAHEPTSRESRQLAIHADACSALIADRLRLPTANEAYLRVLQQVEEYFPDSSDPVVLWLKASALTGLGRSSEAMEITSRISQMGFAGSYRAWP
jgi:eukaryotic-like serine/threonine-protein kinase